MYTLFEVPSAFGSIDQRSKELASEIVARVAVRRERVAIAANVPIFPNPPQPDCFYIVREGTFQLICEGKFLLCINEGDLLAFSRNSPFKEANIRITGDFATYVDEYSWADFTKALKSDSELAGLWNEYNAHQVSLVTLALSALSKEDTDTGPALRGFKPNEIIIQQGAKAAEVFNLVEGHADVFVDGVKVGEILAGEIFGVMAALTGTPRTASVVASNQCMVLVLPKDNFVKLISNRPDTVHKMVEDLSRIIVSLNEQVVEYREVLQRVQNISHIPTNPIHKHGL